MPGASLPNVTKPATHRELGPVDIAPFELLLSSWTEQFWQIENDRKPNNFTIFDHTEHVVMRFRADHDDPSSLIDYPLWTMAEPLLLPSLSPAIAHYNFEEPTIALAMFARLRPGGKIDRHVDSSGAHRRTHKIHVPVRTDPAALFHIGPTDVHLESGRAYEVNNLKKHGATNRAETARVHFIFELYDRGQVDQPNRAPDLPAVRRSG